MSSTWLRLNHFEPGSVSNGPGSRAVIWFQGCSLGCPGCFNPQTHPTRAGKSVTVETLVKDVLQLENSIEGISISGGEPFQQPRALFELLKQIKSVSSLSTLVFSGFTLDEILNFPDSSGILVNLDILISGRYIAAQRTAHGLLGSANKKMTFLTGRYSPENFMSLPEAEVIIHSDGTLTITGIDPLQWEVPGG